MRTFVAVCPPPEVRSALGGAREMVRRPDGRPADRMRWVTPGNVHLTLKYLGDVQEETLGNLSATLRGVCENHSPFDVELRGLGAFPSARRARVLWAGVGAGSDALISLAADVDEALAPLGFEREDRAYTPHLTLGRVKGRPASLDLPPDVRSFGGFRVQRVDLVESTLTPEGAIYGSVEAFALKGGAAADL